MGGKADAFNALLAVDQRQEAGRPCVLNKDGGNNMAVLAGDISKMIMLCLRAAYCIMLLLANYLHIATAYAELTNFYSPWQSDSYVLQ